MRSTRWLLLVAIVALVSGIGIKYQLQRKALEVREGAIVKPVPLGANEGSSSYQWSWKETDTSSGKARTAAEIWADDIRELKDATRSDLKGVRLHLYSKKSDTFDLIKSAAASFYKTDKRLYSDGDVDITLNVPVQGEPKKTLVNIKTSGVNYDTTGRADTNRPSSFTFANGSGTATGASYDPDTHQLIMKSDVKLHWKAQTPQAKPMEIEGGSLEYRETDSQILLKPWGRLTRENSVVEGENAVIHLEDKGGGHRVIRKVEATKAHGTDDLPTRKLVYSADELWIDMNDDGQVQKIIAQTNARLVSVSDTAETTVTAYHVEMNFEAKNKESILSQVTTSGDSVVTSKPIVAKNRPPGETHILRSDKLDMKMRPGGKDIESVVTHGPGTLEFLPNQPIQRHRTLEGGDMVIGYGADNRIESFHTTNAKTHTEPNAEEVKRHRAASATTSKDLVAHFAPKTGQLASMEQSGDFTYDEGDRHARASKATLDGDQNVILLESGARMWDATGSTTADHIRLNERTGDFTAEENVNSSRLPDKDQKKSSDLLSGDQPLQATARKMDSSGNNTQIHYEGDVTLWQGANRIQAAVVDLDRKKHTLIADRNVVTNLWEEPKDDPKKPGAKKGNPVLTVVHAAHLVYTDTDRQAVYTGGAVMNRPGLDVKAKEIRSFLAEQSADSRLEKAFADGAVEIVQTSKDGSRTGTAEHAEYYTADQKVFLKDGKPRLVERRVDGKNKTTDGTTLTYFANDSRLLVDGSPEQRGQSDIKRK